MIVKSENNITVRLATLKDAEDLLNIYAPYVEKTTITFEYEVPSVEEFRNRIKNTLEKFPYLVAEKDGAIVGYACANPFKQKAAYGWAVETTIYLKEDCKRMGIGRVLYTELERILKLQNILNLNACIGYPIEEDEHLTKDSVKFHEKMGYRMVGEFYKCGYKFNRWYNMVWMEKHIGEHVENQPAVKKFGEIQGEI